MVSTFSVLPSEEKSSFDILDPASFSVLMTKLRDHIYLKQYKDKYTPNHLVKDIANYVFSPLKSFQASHAILKQSEEIKTLVYNPEGSNNKLSFYGVILKFLLSLLR